MHKVVELCGHVMYQQPTILQRKIAHHVASSTGITHTKGRVEGDRCSPLSMDHSFPDSYFISCTRALLIELLYHT